MYPHLNGSKYNNAKTIVDNISFDSKMEARRYTQLKLLEMGGRLSKLLLQPSFELQPSFVYQGKRLRCISYVADFQYIENGKKVVEDVKGFATTEFKMKAKMFKYHYPDCELRIIEKC